MPDKKLSLSIVIPVYNEQHHLKACLDSIAAQNEKPDEVIVVDNNSTDKTVEIAQSYPLVRIISEKKQGVGFARTRGFNNVTSDIIGRIDADTVLPPHWTATVRHILRNTRLDAANGPVGYYDMPLGTKNYWIDHQIRKYLYRGAPYIPFLFGSNSALRRSAWEKVRDGLCTERTIHEDLDLAIHLMRADCKILYDRRLLASTSSRRYDDSFKAFRHYMAMYLNTYRHHGIRSIVPRIATGCYWLGYITLWLLRRSYDETTGRHRVSELKRKRRARKNPMA